MESVQAASPSSAECLARLSRMADSLIRIQDEQRFEDGCKAIESVLLSAKPFLHEACPDAVESVGNKIICLLLDIGYHQRARYPCHCALLLKRCLSFSVDESVELSGECVEKASSLVYNFDWSHSSGDAILDCFLLLPLLEASHNDGEEEEAVAHKYTKMQAEVIGTLAQRLRQIYKSNGSADRCHFLAKFAHFPQLPLTADYSASSSSRLCCLLLSFPPKLLLAAKTRFNLQLLYEPWANLLTSLVESFRRKFVQDAGRAEFGLLELGAWRCLALLTPLAAAAPSLGVQLLQLRPGLWQAAVETLQRESNGSATRRLGDIIKVEVYEWFSAHLSSGCVGSAHYSTHGRALLQCCLKELLLIKALDEMKIVKERTEKKRRKEAISSAAEQQQLLEFVNMETFDVTNTCLACLKTLRAIFECAPSGLDTAACQSTVSALVELSRALTEKLAFPRVTLNWAPCLKATCETLCSVCFNLNDIIIPLALVLDVLREAKRYLELRDANHLDLLIKDLNCMAFVSCGPNFKSASVVGGSEVS